jgi:hypothetical protein
MIKHYIVFKGDDKDKARISVHYAHKREAMAAKPKASAVARDVRKPCALLLSSLSFPPLVLV